VTDPSDQRQVKAAIDAVFAADPPDYHLLVAVTDHDEVSFVKQLAQQVTTTRRGRVVRGPFATGSKSERDAIMLETDDETLHRRQSLP
jgi:hypothetical protein